MASTLTRRFRQNVLNFQNMELFRSCCPAISKMSTAQSLEAIQQRPSLCTQNEMKEFKALFPTVVKDLTAIPALMTIQDTNDWMKQVYKFGIQKENTLWAEQAILADQILSSSKNSTSWKTLVNIYACSIHLNFVGNKMVDEIITKVDTEFGCEGSYNLSNDKHISMCDSILVTNSCSLLLKKYFGNLEFYTDMLKLRSGMMYSMPFGRQLNLQYRKDFSNLNTHIYSKMTRFGSALPGFYEPLAGIMIMNGCREPTLFNYAKSLCVEIGTLHNMQLDLLSFNENTEEFTRSVQEGDPTWILAETMENCSKAQRAVLLENYGSKNNASVANVREIFEDLEIAARFEKKKDQTAEIVHTLVGKLTQVEIQKYFEALWRGLF